MKFSISISDFQRILGNLAGVIPSKSTLPVLENFLFELSGNTLRITATDVEISMTATLEVKGSKDGRIAVPAKKILETIRALPVATIEFSAEPQSHRIEMKTETGQYKLTGESTENFPSNAELTTTNELSIGSDVLGRLIGKTSFAASTDELRPAMMGVLFQISEKDIRSVATDGHRLVRMVTTGSADRKITADVLIPVKALNLIAKCLTGTETQIAFDERQARFMLGEITLVTKLIEEKYPNYESVIPSENEKQLIVNKNQLLASVRRTALYASSTTHQVRLAMKKDTLKVSAEDIDFGSEAHETMTADYSSDAMEIGFNAGYVVDALGHLDTDEVVFHMHSPSRAVTVTPSSQREGEDLMMLVMPVRINS